MVNNSFDALLDLVCENSIEYFGIKIHEIGVKFSFFCSLCGGVEYGGKHALGT